MLGIKLGSIYRPDQSLIEATSTFRKGDLILDIWIPFTAIATPHGLAFKS